VPRERRRSREKETEEIMDIDSAKSELCHVII
jgi:hypothetical protein